MPGGSPAPVGDCRGWWFDSAMRAVSCWLAVSFESENRDAEVAQLAAKTVISKVLLQRVKLVTQIVRPPLQQVADRENA